MLVFSKPNENLYLYAVRVICKVPLSKTQESAVKNCELLFPYILSCCAPRWTFCSWLQVMDPQSSGTINCSPPSS